MNVIKNIIDEKVYGVVRVAEGDKVVEISEALIKGGLRTIEIVISNSSIRGALVISSKSHKTLIPLSVESVNMNLAMTSTNMWG